MGKFKIIDGNGRLPEISKEFAGAGLSFCEKEQTITGDTSKIIGIMKKVNFSTPGKQAVVYQQIQY